MIAEVRRYVDEYLGSFGPNLGLQSESLSAIKTYLKIYGRYHLHRRQSDQITETEHGFRMQVDTSDFAQRRHLTDEGRAEQELTAFLSRKMRDLEGDFLDVGANIGFYTLLFCQQNSGTAYAFEPLSVNREQLRRNLSLNGVDNCQVFASGLSDTQEETTLYYHPCNRGAGGTVPSGPGFQSLMREEDATFAPLDEVSGLSETVSLVKIDVEGHELAVVRGARETLRRQKPTILIELHPDRLEKRGQSVDTLLRELFELGYDGVTLVDETVTLGREDALESIERIENSDGLWFESENR